MRVRVPFAGDINPEVHASVLAASATGHSWECWNVGGSDRAYYDALSAWWSYGSTFGIVEHDIVIHETALDELADCPHDWCAFPFDYVGMRNYGLACVKFSGALIARHPDAMLRAGVMSDDRHPARHWCRLDAWLTGVLEAEGERRHEHPTVVRHLNPSCSHGCIPNH